MPTAPTAVLPMTIAVTYPIAAVVRTVTFSLSTVALIAARSSALDGKGGSSNRASRNATAGMKG